MMLSDFLQTCPTCGFLTKSCAVKKCSHCKSELVDVRGWKFSFDNKNNSDFTFRIHMNWGF